MKIHCSFRNYLIAAILAGSILALFAFSGKPAFKEDQTARFQDTVPSQKRIDDPRKSATRDLDRELEQLQHALKSVDEARNVDFEKMQREVEESVKKINIEKIQRDVELAISATDMEKIRKEVEASLEKIDFEKIEKEIEASMEKATELEKSEMKREMEKAKAEIRNQLKNADLQKELREIQETDMKEMQKEMQNLKKELEKVKIDISKEKLNMKNEMDKAGAEIEKTRKELTGFQEMIYSMQNEGLLNTKNDYSIELKNKQLIINQKIQPESIYNKYRNYFNSDQTRIEKINGEMKISKTGNE